MKTAVNRGEERGRVISWRTVETRRDGERGSCPLSSYRFLGVTPFDRKVPDSFRLSIVPSHGLFLMQCRVVGEKTGGRGGGIEEGKLQRRLGEPLKEFGSVTKFVSPSRELIESWLTEGLFYRKCDDTRSSLTEIYF